MERILLVDDDEINIMVTEMILSEMGYEVTTAYTGGDCLSILDSEKFDLLLLDIDLPDINGIEVLERVREKPEIRDTKTVILTASSQDADMTDAIRLGALDFIKKPALPENLISSVRQALSKAGKDTILAVDDEPMNLMATEKLFGIRYNLICASSGGEALGMIKEKKPDLVLLDLHMPEMDGLEVLKRIQKLEGCDDIPVVFLTADDDADTEAEMFKAGAMDFISKPFVMQVALQRIRHVLELKHLQDSLHEEVERKTEALRESNKKIRNLSKQVIWALAGAIDAKDSYTNGHSTRVADYSRELARRLGKSEKEQDEIYNTALLHDVGKVGIPINIINKPGKLTEEEYGIIKSHTEKGYEILKTISEMPELSIGARWHHERYDGKGYPDGKAGNDICEIARIICVADCYDAMSSDRSYRKALPQSFVREEIERGRGTQFDPRIAEVMLQMIDEDKDYSMRQKRTEAL
ncbi:MAG: response regulator [Lachnospiraceae bacterium]|nr:response regulator [Lachnospiraceae bacterium]